MKKKQVKEPKVKKNSFLKNSLPFIVSTHATKLLFFFFLFRIYPTDGICRLHLFLGRCWLRLLFGWSLHKSNAFIMKTFRYFFFLRQCVCEIGGSSWVPPPQDLFHHKCFFLQTIFFKWCTKNSVFAGFFFAPHLPIFYCCFDNFDMIFFCFSPKHTPSRIHVATFKHK